MNHQTFTLGQTVHYCGKNYLVSHVENGYIQLKYTTITNQVIDLFSKDISKISV